MKVSINKITNRILETQFNNNSEILIKNALSTGLNQEDILIVDMTELEFKNAIKKQDYELIRKQEIINELNELDRKVIRPLLDGETEKVEEIKNQKLILREELKNL